MTQKKMVILDGNSLINRAFYALPPMNNSRGEHTNAIYGLTNMLFKIFDDEKPDYIAAAFDRKAPTFRHKEYAEYKAGRKKMPEELFMQLEPVKELFRAFNIGIYEIDSYEADDIIGTISKKFESEEIAVSIYSGDKDILQLVSAYTRVLITRKGITETDIYDIQGIKDKYGFEPKGIIDLKGLMGDQSDNIPGVAGVGEKTALKLLNEYLTVEGVYENLDKISGVKLKENLEKCREDAFMSKRLATIYREVPLEFSLSDMGFKDYDSSKVLELFGRFEFRSLMDKVKQNSSAECEVCSSIPELKEYTRELNLDKDIKDKGYINFLLIHNGREVSSMLLEGGVVVSKNDIRDFFPIFEDENIDKNTFGIKHMYNYLGGENSELNGHVFDAEIAAYLLNPAKSKYEMTDFLSTYCSYSFREEDLEKGSLKLEAAFTDNLSIIKEKLIEEIKKYGMDELYYNIELPLAKVLSSMELIGFKVDMDVLTDIGFNLSEEIDRLTAEIYDAAGEEFNINSPKQLGVILFEKLCLPVIKKTKTGYSTDAEVLDELSDKHEIVEKILSYRQLVKLKSTYIDGLKTALAEDGRIHSSFNQTVTATGRISSTEPNLQNIPIKMEQGRKIRKAFIPTNKDFIILSADYSQIELRVLAHVSDDENLIHAFNNDQDIHTRTASEVFGIPMDEVTSLQRSRAKAVNFGIMYGLSDFGLSRDIKTSRKEAKTYIDNYFARYSGVKNYLDNAIEDAREKGYVKTIMNRIRFIPEIKSSNRNVKMLGERLAMNTPIQGTAADIIKIAMINVYNRIKKEKLKSRLILQVHDELVLEAHNDEIETLKTLVRDEMENAVKLSVKLTVDVKTGNSWYEAK